MTPSHEAKLALLLGLLGPGACVGRVGDLLPARGQTPGAGASSEAVPPAVSALRRLSVAEYDATVRDLLELDGSLGTERLPEDSTDPFDNDYTKQRPSNALVDALQAIAEDAARAALADPERRARLLPCIPTGVDDSVCMRRFIESFGRRALRRPPTEDQIEGLLAVQALAAEDAALLGHDFADAAALVVRALLQTPQFLYRLELGTPDPDRPGVHRLDDWEIASRLSYFLWGTTPDDALLDRAAERALTNDDARRDVAEQMLLDPRAADHLERFHAMWLGYTSLSHDAELVQEMRRETATLLRDVVFERRAPYVEVFLADRTLVGPRLAEHYGLPAPAGGEPAWVAYGDSGRRGILSHGSVLSAFTKPADTSPTLRGIFVRERLMCQEIPPPPPNVNTDVPPATTDSPCKWDRYAVHRQGGCAGCHDQMDPIGFGLEGYDRTGAARVHDDGLPECVISGRGQLATPDGTLEFRGPGELGTLLAEGGWIEPCALKQAFRHAFGRRERPEDAPALDQLRPNPGARFDELLLAIVASEWFALRRDDEEE